MLARANGLQLQCWSALTLDDVENAGQHLVHSFCAGQRFTVAIAQLRSFLPSVRRWWYVLLTSYFFLSHHLTSSFHCLAFGGWEGSGGLALHGNFASVFGFAFGVWGSNFRGSGSSLFFFFWPSSLFASFFVFSVSSSFGIDP